MQSVTKGVLDRDQQSLTPKQRDRYNQLVQQGIDPKVARQLAIVLTKSAKPLGAAYAKAKRLQRENGGDKSDEQRRVDDYLREKGHAPVAKGGPGSGPQPGGGGLHGKILGELKQRAKDARAKGDHARATRITERATKLAEQMLGAVKKGFAQSFVEGAKEALPRIYYDQLHSQARARAGGRASGMARRALGDAEKAQLLQRRQALKDELALLEAQLKKSSPPAQEVAVDAPVQVTPKQKKQREKLAVDIAAQALRAVGKAAPAGKEWVDVSVQGTVLKSAQPEWKRIIHSVVYAPGEVDAHGDYMTVEDIEKMAHDAMRSGLYVNHEHQAGAIEADIVESYVAPQDFNLKLADGKPYHIPKGSHVIGMHVWGDEPWAKIQSGEYVGYSLEGTALRDVA